MASVDAGNRSWVYHFTRTSPTWPLLGAAHAAEIAYVFGNLDPAKVKPADQELSARMMDRWIRFAQTGNPNLEGRTSWPEYTREKDQHFVFDDTVKVDAGLRKEACDLLDEILQSKRADVQAVGASQ